MHSVVTDWAHASLLIPAVMCFGHQREPVLLKELGKVKHPDRVFHFSCQIWFPHRWVVTRHFSGEDELIPTVLTDTPINQTADAAHVPTPDEV